MLFVVTLAVKRLLLHLSVFFCTLCTMFYILPGLVAAQQEFTTDYNTTYTVLPNGDANVKQEITLTNNFSTIYATSYNLSLEGKKPENIKATQDGKPIPVQTEETDIETKISVSFPDAVVGKEKTRKFTVSYTVPHLALQNGQVWELTIPRLSSPENFNEYNLILTTPKSLGRLAYISPAGRTQTETEDSRIFTFIKDDLTKAGVVAGFGDFQVFSFNLSYHLQNPFHDKRGKSEIALVPDTAFQRVYYDTISPKPESIRLDEDGNWLASYILKPGEVKDIKTTGEVQIFANPQTLYPKITPQNRDYYLSSTDYWQTEDIQIVSIAQSLKTPRAIYDYVSKTLTYNYSRVSDSAQRLGAKAALNSPSDAICTEYTDLFVTLSRAAGIPAREVNGYAYTENPQVQPLSLVADVLHAWPEYWDNSANIWRPVDPTWASTTGGVNFFDKFDLSHITFVVHGRSSDSPAAAGSYKLAQTPQRDVSVTFGQLPNKRESVPEIKITQGHSLLPFIQNKIHVQITNPGPVALYNQPVTLQTSAVVVKSQAPDNISFLAPYQTQKFDVSYTIPILSQGKKSKIQVLVGDYRATFELSPSSVGLLSAVSIFLVLVAVLGCGFLVIKFLPKVINKYVKRFKRPS